MVSRRVRSQVPTPVWGGGRYRPPGGEGGTNRVWVIVPPPLCGGRRRRPPVGGGTRHWRLGAGRHFGIPSPRGNGSFNGLACTVQRGRGVAGRTSGGFGGGCGGQVSNATWSGGSGRYGIRLCGRGAVLLPCVCLYCRIPGFLCGQTQSFTPPPRLQRHERDEWSSVGALLGLPAAARMVAAVGVVI